MSTDFKRLFANLEHNPERGSGSTYTLVYQAIGSALRSESNYPDEAVIIYPDSRSSEYLHDIADKIMWVMGARPRWREGCIVGYDLLDGRDIQLNFIPKHRETTHPRTRDWRGVVFRDN